MDSLSFKTISANKFTIKRSWIIIDANGKSLGRLSSKIAHRIIGKHKVDFTPHINCGDNVIVINAEKIRIFNKNWKNKLYVRFTGYPGGQKITTAQEEFKKCPSRLIEKSVKGMLPKNRLGRQLYKNLHVYQGIEHKHKAQNPKVINLDDIF